MFFYVESEILTHDRILRTATGWLILNCCYGEWELAPQMLQLNHDREILDGKLHFLWGISMNSLIILLCQVVGVEVRGGRIKLP